VFTRIYIVGNRRYQVAVAGPKGAKTPEQAARFLTSFRLTAVVAFDPGLRPPDQFPPVEFPKDPEKRPPFDFKKDPPDPVRLPPVVRDWNLPPLPAALPLQPPGLNQDKVERPLPDTIQDVAVGGGGRFLLLALPKTRQVAVFDANIGRVVKFLSVGA